MSETFTPPTISPATIRDPAACERDLGKDDFNECRKPTHVAFVATEPPRPAATGATRTWGFCTEEHALAEAEALWGCGFTFPDA